MPFKDSDEITVFVAHNRDLPTIHKSGIRLRFVEGWKDGWIAMAVEIHPDTRQDAIEDAWQWIKEWRERLAQHQGTWTGGGCGELYMELWRLNRTIQDDGRGWSYQKIANHINRRIFELCREGELYRAQEIMECMGITPETIAESIAYVQETGAPFPPNEPIDNGKVRRKIDTVRKIPGNLAHL